MSPEPFRRTISVVASGAIALVVAALAMGLSTLVIGSRSASSQRVAIGLVSNPSSFTITSAIYPSPSCSGTPGALFFPGTPRCAVFTIQNLLNVPITVLSITTTLDSAFPAPPAQCAPPTYFTLPTFSGSFTVGAGATTNLPGVPVGLKESGTIQNACEGFAYHFKYTGSAQYTDSTTTVLTSSSNPSLFGQPVTFTATVGANNPSLDTSKPTGTVTFYECTNSACTGTKTALTGGLAINATTGKASFSTTALSLGPHYLDAVYTPADATNFMASNGTLTQTVGLPASCDNSTHNGGYTVKSGQSICLTGRVNGGLTVQPGGAVYLSGATINGGTLTASGATAIRICGTTVNGNVSVTGSSGFVMIGDGGDDGTPACAGNIFSANLTVTNNTGGIEIGGNTIAGTVTVSGNVTTPLGEGVAEVEANKIGGSLSCATSNNPALTNDGLKNTVGGTKSGQCAGGGF
jgi:Bacterial Ig-like domain (group 3)